MEKSKLILNLLEKTLSVNEKKIRLSDSLINAEKCTLKGISEQTCLRLIYNNNKVLFDEASKAYIFLSENGLMHQMVANAWEDQDDTVQIIGKYNLEIIKPNKSYETPPESLLLP